LIEFICGATLTALLMPVVSKLAVRFGIVSKPSSERWHKEGVIPRIGGAAVFVVSLYFFLDLPLLAVAGLIIMFGIGLIDDVKRLSAFVKLAPQAIASLMMARMLIGDDGNLVVLGFACLAIMFVVNAYNMMDNMDGVAAGSGLVVALGLGLIGATSTQSSASMALAGSILGLLFFSAPPARIFMGDCGSHFIGAALVYLTLQAAATSGSSFLLLLLVPTLDFVYVTTKRLLQRRSIFVGGCDHLSHDLHRKGLNERQIAILYSLATAITVALVYLINK
jgi:UDP-GlcNAc:undecaprenyl-phosphate/decaprenyl-phosphate GlcNAc-1-phosphate transferase